VSELTEQAIRPVQLMAKQRIAALTDVGRLLSRCSEFVEVNCPACGGNDHVPKFEKNGISYVECNVCRTFYVNPRPPSEVLEWFYRGSPNYAYWNEVIFPASEAARLERIFAPRVDRLLELCRKYAVATHAILEVGAGFGTFCGEVKRRNVFTRVVAVEPTPDLAQTCRERGLEVLELPVEQIQLKSQERFDVVASFEVIEHLFAPVDFVGHMVRLLKPGGILMLACPNGQGFDIETLGTISNTVDHEHLNYFNLESLAGLLAHCGLEILESFTPGRLDAELVRNKILAGEFDVSDQPFLKKVLIDDWASLGLAFQEFLVQQGLSSNMWVVARKPRG
jgi:2-polyprenyl-3-methyl-5-hydroxy-6-metoxy-1,4-benzoquinol methylase/ribosomal protein S27E